MINNKIKVAIIDSGIDINVNELKKYVSYKDGYKMNENGQVVKNKNLEILHHHGTALALIIKDLCQNVEFYSISIFDENLLSDGRILIHSIEKALDMNPDVIHLSLGTKKIRYVLKLQQLIKKANKNNISIVSALNNDGTISFPSNLRGVIKVEGGNFENYENYGYYKSKFKAPSGLNGINGKDELNQINLVGNSMAAAYMTGHICRLLSNNKKRLPLKQVIKCLTKNKEVFNINT